MIKKDKFEQLEQSDRIEYLLRRLSNPEPNSATFQLLTFFVLTIFPILTLAMLVYFNNGDVSILELMGDTIFPLIKIAFLIVLVFDLIRIAFYFRNLKKLDDKFLKRGGFK